MLATVKSNDPGSAPSFASVVLASTSNVLPAATLNARDDAAFAVIELEKFIVVESASAAKSAAVVLPHHTDTVAPALADP